MNCARLLVLLAILFCMTCGCSNQDWRSSAEEVCVQQEQLLPILKRIKNASDAIEIAPEIQEWRDEYIVLMNEFSDTASTTKIHPRYLDKYEERFDEKYASVKVEAERILDFNETADKELIEAFSVIYYSTTSRSNPFKYAKSKSRTSESENAE